MLTLILGRAGTGKTALVMNDIKQRMDEGEANLLLIVPEQYSHEAERQLCTVCGDSLSLHGEVLSFTRLCSRVFSEAGGAPRQILDAGSQMLIMHQALESAAHKLRIYGKTGMRAELVKNLLVTVREMKSLGISPEKLEKAAARASVHLADKLRDIAMLYGAYDGILHTRGADPADRLTLLGEMIGSSSVGSQGRTYFDGFNDFTSQELRVISELMRKNADLTVCLTLDPEDSENGEADGAEVFELPRATAAALRRLAEENGVEVRTVVRGQGQRAAGAQDLGTRIQDLVETGEQGEKVNELVFLEKHLFGYENAAFAGRCEAITLCAAPTRYAECEYAAHYTLELVRSGYRWRDIGVMARNWEEYGAVCENVFEKYGIPVFAGGREEVIEKPPAALIDAALEIAAFGFDYIPVFKYLKTGLAGIAAEDCAELENYVIKWRIRGSLWMREWKLPPPGHNEEDHPAVLKHLNTLRAGIIEPLDSLRRKISGISSADEKTAALYAFLEDAGFAQRIAQRAAAFEKRGEARLADEYAQLWEIITNAMDSCFLILGKTLLSAAEFRKLFMLTLSSYDIGVIPVSLDRTALGGIAMNRRRDLKCLIVLGATDGNMPMIARKPGVFSDSEREELSFLGADMPSGPEEQLLREMNMLYSALTLPSRKLIITYPARGDSPSFIVKRIKSLFKITETALREEEYMSSAAAPCHELAALYGHTNNSPLAAAAREYAEAEAEGAKRLKAAEAIVHAGRGNLSASAAQILYGSALSLSPSRADRYYSCAFAHFLYSGLRLAPREVSSFDAPEAGTFMHYVLEGVSRGIKESTGFKSADEEKCRELTSQFINKYAHEELLDFEGKSDRFIYLFRRLEDDVQRVVLDMIAELKRSEFEPLDFELELGPRKGTQANAAPGSTLAPFRGIVDRVDGWNHGGKLYLRVIDYKTGRKALDLTDVLHGRNMQMLIYLFALQEFGSSLYGSETVPSGVLYVPARDVVLKAARNTADSELIKLRQRELRRGGLILDDSSVIEAMEGSDEKKYLPVKTLKDGSLGGDSLVSAKQIVLLSQHVGHMMRSAAESILSGSIECSPYYKNPADNACLYCEYHAVCGFDEESGDKRRFMQKLNAGEVWEKLAPSGLEQITYER